MQLIFLIISFEFNYHESKSLLVKTLWLHCELIKICVNIKGLIKISWKKTNGELGEFELNLGVRTNF